MLQGRTPDGKFAGGKEWPCGLVTGRKGVKLVEAKSLEGEGERERNLLVASRLQP